MTNGTTHRVTRLAAAVILTALMLASCGLFRDNPTDGQVELDQYDGKEFVVSYPSEWKRDEDGKIMPSVIFEVADLPRDAKTPNASMHVDVTQDPGTLKDTVNAFIATSKRERKFKLIKQKEINVEGDAEGYIIRKGYTLQDGMRLRQTDLLTLTKSGKTLDIRLICRKNQCGRYQGTFQAILDSTRITG